MEHFPEKLIHRPVDIESKERTQAKDLKNRSGEALDVSSIDGLYGRFVFKSAACDVAV